MARNKRMSGARKALILLTAIVVVLGGVIGLSAAKLGGESTPKLALDLSGGTEMILSPKATNGGGDISKDQLDQAVDIIRQRVDGSGVSEAEVSTQSGRNVVVSMPGVPSQETRDLIQASAQMSFRSVLAEGSGAPVPEKDRTDYAKMPKPSDKPKDGSDSAWITPELQKQYELRDCAAHPGKDDKLDPQKAVVACSDDGQQKYILGPVELNGSDISDANYSQVQSGNGVSTGQWGVNISFNNHAKDVFKTVTERLNGFYGKNQNDPKASFAIMLDGSVLQAPRSQAVISDGKAQITGNFTEKDAESLSEQLKYGALPISFHIESEQQISATLGTDQLRMGIIAGIIGLLLVCIYSLFQYRLLGFVTIASLLVAGVVTYEAITLLGWAVNYRLSLAGVAGLIVAIGQTADSFIVYFERIRDGLRDGRSVPSAVDHGWLRARRTIWASKGVNLLAAVVLYFVAVGNVRGFAFTLGLTAIADLMVIFWFTHPMMVLLSRTKFFGEGHKHSGLDARALGYVPLYRGAGRLRDPEDSPRASKSRGKSGSDEDRPMTIAERRRAEALASREQTTDSGKTPDDASGENSEGADHA
ncbi:protein translocase subunit SecD [uncultured Kocuria sp.]|uniref:protein translocase subunit SecD n=1 Tax=uncultured Kocuria sp. TaxID=259305 RepID=UPI0025915116|nr:protein translocase subunit SecD [uncultured Kocuria sp.]MCT1366740.1 protein translocase subunit SecD [Rothia sp. p3-SID1597]